MKRGFIIIVLFIFPAYSVSGKSKGNADSNLTYGLEWAYTATFLSGWHYNFFDPDGFRVEMKDLRVGLISNGDINFHLGYDFNRFWNLSFHAGYAGAGDFHPVMPLSFRVTRYFKETNLGDKWFAFGEAGSGLSVQKSPRELLNCKLGGGYRISLSRDTKLDFLAAFRIMYTHPEITHFNQYITNINRNDGLVVSLSIGASLTF